MVLTWTIAACDRERALDGPLVRGAPIDAPAAQSLNANQLEPVNCSASPTGDELQSTPGSGESASARRSTPRGPADRDAGPAGAISISDDDRRLHESFRTDADGYIAITLAMLADFEYQQPEPHEIKPRPAGGGIWDCKGQIPSQIRELDRRKIVVRGFMVPIEIEEGRVKSFVLSNNRLFCCFGITPWLNEWISVRMPEGQTVQYVNDLLVTVYGTLSVGEEIDEGWVLSLFRMTADRVSYASGI